MNRIFLIGNTITLSGLCLLSSTAMSQSLSGLSAAKRSLSPLNSTSSVPEPSYKTYGRTQTRDERYGAGIIPPRYQPGDGVDAGYGSDFDLRHSREGLSDDTSMSPDPGLTDVNR